MSAITHFSAARPLRPGWVFQTIYLDVDGIRELGRKGDINPPGKVIMKK
jgi:hypothetical protein